MNGLTDYAAKQVWNALWQGTPLGNPATWYLGLAVGGNNFTPTGGGTEATYPGYARKAVPASNVNFNAASGSITVQSSNAALIQFAQATTGANASVTGLGFFDALTGGNCWAICPLAGPIAVTSGTIVQFAALEITPTLISSSSP